MSNVKPKAFSPFLLKSILTLLINDDDYREKFFPILSHVYFDHEDKLIHNLAKAIWSLNDLYGKFPSVDVLTEELFVQKGQNISLWLSTPTKEERKAFKDFFLDIIEAEISDKKYVEDNTTKILGFLAVHKVILENRAAFLDGSLDVEDFAKEVVSASTFASPINLGINLMSDLDKRTEIRTSTAITPGLIELNIPHFKNYLEEGGLPPGSLAFAMASSNGGKCHTKKTPILMFDGKIKNVENIVVGDKLMGPDSLPRSVLSTTSGFGPLFNIIPNTGMIWGCNDKHVLTLQNTEYSKKDSKLNRKIIDIPLDEFLKKPKTFQTKYKLFTPDSVEFSKIEPCLIDPYFLGLWFGDGTKKLSTIMITSMDKEIVNYCEKIAAESGLVLSSYKNSKSINGKASTYRFCGKSGRKNAIAIKLRALVGENITIPDCIKYGSIETRLQFLAGFIDTDGYLHHGFYEIVQKKEEYVKDLQFIAQSLGFRSHYTETVKTIKKINFSGKYFRLYIAGEVSKIPVKLDRKKHIQILGRKQGKRTGFSVISTGEGEFYGFTLDSDGRYLLGDFTVTHNSAFLIHIAHDAAKAGHNVLYVSAELSEDMIKRRFDSCMTCVPISDVKRLANRVKKLYNTSASFSAAAERIQIVEVPNGTTRPSDINVLIERLKKRGFNTNLLVVDYADNLKAPRKADAYRHELTDTWKELKAIAQQHHMIVWTASQMNDAGTAAAEQANGVLTIRHMNESRGKIHLSDLCIGIARTQEEKDTNLARLVLLKNRLGPGDGSVVQINTRFEISRLFGAAAHVVSMASMSLDDPIEGLSLEDQMPIKSLKERNNESD